MNRSQPHDVDSSTSGPVALTDGQQRAVDDIVQAVGAGEYWRVGMLLERFIADAELPALFALRSALSEAVALRGR
ncbi:hypothetical protein [Streptomyces sp. NPDC059928]|uniref:hypothetical protein n=1 Tax=unclassified Streptomyces TaxID=2593676 RepID=UPI00364E2CE7